MVGFSQLQKHKFAQQNGSQARTKGPLPASVAVATAPKIDSATDPPTDRATVAEDLKYGRKKEVGRVGV